MASDSTGLIKTFAALMDSNRYVEAGDLIATDCLYKYRDSIIAGRDAILKTYIDNYESASKVLDEIQFLSEIEPLAKDKYKLKYLDRIRKDDLRHDHRCEQLIQFKDGQIVEIQHIDLPGEDESLQKFFRAAGIK